METPNEKTIDVPVTIKVPENSPLQRLVNPHKVKSRKVTDADMERVVEEAKVLYAICFELSGVYTGAYAMAHPQIDDKDPLCLYVTADKEIIINPVITRHSNYEIDHEEGCVSYGGKKWTPVKRWHKCELEFQTIMVDPDNKDKFKLSDKQYLSLSGQDAFIAEHEIDHLFAKYIYEK